MHLTADSYRRGITVGLLRKSFGAALALALVLWALPLHARTQAQTEKKEAAQTAKPKEAEAASEPRALTQGQVVAGELRARQFQVYLIAATKGQYIRAAVSVRGDSLLAVSLQSPDGKQFKGVSTPGLNRTLVAFRHVAQSPGTYRLELRAEAAGAAYEVRLEALRYATPQDRKQVAADALYAESVNIFYKATGNDRQEAVVKLKQALAIWKELGDQTSEAEALGSLAYVYYFLGQYAQATEAHQQALAIWRLAGNRFWEAMTLHNMAVTYYRLGEKGHATLYLEQSMKLWRSLYDPPELTEKLDSAATFYQTLGDQRKALELYEEILRTSRGAGNRRDEAAALNNLGSTYATLGDNRRALETLTAAYAAARDIRDAKLEQQALAGIQALAPHESAGAMVLKEWSSVGAELGMAKSAGGVAQTGAKKSKEEKSVATLGGGKTLEEAIQSSRTGPPAMAAGGGNSDGQSTEQWFWGSVKDSADPAEVALYLRRYPDGKFADLARTRLSALAGAGAAADEGGSLTINRFPAVETQNPVYVGVPFALQVFLLQNPARGVTPPPVSMRGDARGQPFKAEVIISAEDFELDSGSSNRSEVEVPPDGDSPPAIFRLKAKPIDAAKYTSKVFVTVTYEQKFLTRFSYEITILPPPSQAPKAGELHQSEQSEGSSGPSSSVVGNPGVLKGLNSRPKTPTLNPSIGEGASGGGRAAPVVEESSNKEPVKKEVSKEESSEKTAKPQVRQYQPVVLEKDAPAADLTVVLIEGFDPRNPRRTFIQVESKFFKSQATFLKPREQQGWIDDGYETFAQMSTQRSKGAKLSRDKAVLAAGSPPPDLAVSQALGFGRQLYLTFAPALFKEAFWKVRKELGDSFRSIQIYTNDPNFPWELLRPVASDGSAELDFLGIEYAVGRWPMHNTGELQKLPLRSASVSELNVIAPLYAGPMELLHQKEELQALESIPGFNFKRVPGQISEVKRLFDRFPQGIIHFAGHGVVVELPGKSQQFSILLEDGEISLIEWHGMVSRKNRTHPFIFFNACDLGRTRRVANFVDGWAPAAVEAGASGYVGALWPLNDEGASRFGVEFYRTLLSQLEEGPIFVADALRLTRRKFFQNNDPTFLGYVFYGDPNLRLVRDAGKK